MTDLGHGQKEIINKDTEVKGKLTGLGDIKGFVVSYNNTTSVAISAGYLEANGKFYSLSSSTTHTMTGLGTGHTFHHIYIDDSASTPPTPTFINVPETTAAPVWSDSKQGWYNGDDRAIGCIVSLDGSAVVSPFWHAIIGKNIICRFGTDSVSFIPPLSSSQNPNGTFQNPNVRNGSAVTPANAVRACFAIGNTDSGAIVYNGLTNAEHSPAAIARGQLFFSGYEDLASAGWITLGASRNVKIAGEDTNDNNQYLKCTGYEYTR